jgi:hypothetical protein
MALLKKAADSKLKDKRHIILSSVVVSVTGLAEMLPYWATFQRPRQFLLEKSSPKLVIFWADFSINLYVLLFLHIEAVLSMVYCWYFR